MPSRNVQFNFKVRKALFGASIGYVFPSPYRFSPLGKTFALAKPLGTVYAL